MLTIPYKYNNDNLNIFWKKKFGRYKNKNICQYYHKKDSNREEAVERQRERERNTERKKKEIEKERDI